MEQKDKLEGEKIYLRLMTQEDTDLIAEYITLVLNDYDNSRDKVRAGVEGICKKYPLYE